MTKFRLGITAFAACSALLLSACSTSGAPAGTADGELEKTDLTVGVLPLADYAAVYWAEEKGLFEAEGLKVTLEPIQGGPIGIQKVATGELDFAISNSISASIMQAQGAPVTNVTHTSSLGLGSGIVFVNPNSPIDTIDDLHGKTLGTNTTRNIGDVTFNNLVRSLGKDIEPSFIEVPFPEMIPGVQAGSIDAGYAPEPFASAAKNAGMRVIADVTSGPNEHLAASTFVAGDKFVSENPDTTAAFARAIYAAGAEMSEDEKGFRSWLPAVTRVSDDVAETMVLPDFRSTPDLDGLEHVASMLKEQGLVPDDYDIVEHTYILPDSSED
ncbi:ABC transporter substrate-binding protein [Rhodococcus sp. DT1]|nr:ABC transporter substrate-binding protein [Rhodococcus sp. 105337]